MKTPPVAVSLFAAAALLCGCAKQKKPVAGYDADISQATGFFQAAPAGANPDTDAQQTLLTVNGTPVTRSQLQLEAYRLAAIRGLTPERVAQEKDTLLAEAEKALVRRALLSQAAEKEGLRISSADIAGELEKIRKSVPEGSTLEDELKKQNVTLEQMAENIREGLKLEKVMEAHAGNPAPATPEEIEAFYKENLKGLSRPETVTAIHIVQALKAGEDPAAALQPLIEGMEAIRKQALDPRADFEFLAQTHTQQKGPDGKPQTKAVIPRGSTPPRFEQEIFKLEPNDVSEVLVLENRAHLLKVVEKKPAEVPTLEQATPRIQDVLTVRRKQESITAYINGLLQEARIERAEPSGKKETPDEGVSGKPAGAEGTGGGAR